MHQPFRLDRRTTLKWVLAVGGGLPLLSAAATATVKVPQIGGNGFDPDLLRNYQPGELWPLTLSTAERRVAQALCDLIIPSDDISPSASAVGVVDFLDEWISAPFPDQVEDRTVLLEGLSWVDAESQRRFGALFAELNDAEKRLLCDPISHMATAPPQLQRAAYCFARIRDLTATGFYTTPEGRRDLNFVGNVPSTRFDGPPPEVLRRVGLDVQLGDDRAGDHRGN